MICVTLPFDDFTLQQTGRQSMADLRVTLNRKVMGLLFHSKSDENVTRKMLLKRSREDKPAVIEVESEYPKCKNKSINVVYTLFTKLPLYQSSFFCSCHSKFGGAIWRGDGGDHPNQMEDSLLDIEFRSIICLR